MNTSSTQLVDETIRKRFERAWISGRPVRVEDCLPSDSSPVYLPTLEELVHIELEFAWKAWHHSTGSTLLEPPRIEEYVRRFSQLARPNILRRLVHTEFYVRDRLGDAPRRGEYERRFAALHLTEGDFPSAICRGAGNTTADGDGAVRAGAGLAPQESVAANGRKLGRFLVKGELARGGLGRVLLAHDPHLRRDVAIKEMLPHSWRLPDLVDRFRGEAQITGQLEHPHIVPIHELGEQHDGRPFYAMKFVRGRTLQQVIQETHRLPDGTAEGSLQRNEMLRVFVSVCRAVAYAHSRNVLHRDLKPSNILVGNFGEVQLVDWGLAKVMVGQSNADSATGSARRIDSTSIPSEDQSTANPTTTGSIVGTPSFMSPEQARGESESLDQCSDIYSLGAILYELLVGKRPFNGKCQQQVIERVKVGLFPEPRSLRADIPRCLEAICLRAMSLRPADRYQSAEDLAEDISRWQAGDPVSAYVERCWQRAWRWTRRHKSFCLSAVAGTLACLLTLGAWHWREGTRIDLLRRRTWPLVLTGQAALSSGELDAARLSLTRAVAITADEPRLSDLCRHARRLAGEAELKIGNRSARQRAQVRLQRFRKRRDEVFLHGTLFTQGDLTESLEMAESAAKDGLALFGVDPGHPAIPKLNHDHFTRKEQQEIREACRELLLLYVSVRTQPRSMPPTRSAKARARDALAVLEKARTTGLGDKAYYMLRYKCLFILEDAPAASDTLTHAINATAVDAIDHFLVGLELFYADRAGVVDAFNRALEKRPGDFWSEYFLAVCHGRHAYDDPHEARLALVHLNTCLGRQPEFPWAYLLRGYVYGALDRPEAAERDFRKALTHGVDPYALHVDRGIARWRSQQRDAGVSDLLRAMSLNPNRVQAYLTLASFHLESNQLDKAEPLLEHALALNPRLSRAHELHGMLALHRRDYRGALQRFEQAIHLGAPDRSEVAGYHLEIGRIFQIKGQLAKAKKACDEALRIRPDLTEAYALRAFVLRGLGCDDESLLDLDHYLDKIHGSPCNDLASAVARERGLLRSQRCDTSGAMQDFALALTAASGAIDHVQLAAVRARRGWMYLHKSHELALNDFEVALQLDPQSADAHNGRGFVYARIGDCQRAIQDAEAAHRLMLTRDQLAPGQLTHTARIYALAGALVTNTEDQTRYRDRAIELLHQAVEQLKSDEKPAFLAGVVSDPALQSMRDRAEFKLWSIVASRR